VDSIKTHIEENKQEIAVCEDCPSFRKYDFRCSILAPFVNKVLRQWGKFFSNGYKITGVFLHQKTSIGGILAYNELVENQQYIHDILNLTLKQKLLDMLFSVYIYLTKRVTEGLTHDNALEKMLKSF
jgi:hypothetical protein